MNPERQIPPSNDHLNGALPYPQPGIGSTHQDSLDDWKSALARAQRLTTGGEISQRELNDVRAQARQAGVIPIGSALFNRWDEALSHARELHKQGAISTPEFIELNHEAQFAMGQKNSPKDILGKVQNFLSNFHGPGSAY